jgi:hypothetical protein
MRFSILGDDSPTSLETSVVGDNTDKPQPDPSQVAGEVEISDDLTESELPETAEYLVAGPPQRSLWRHVLNATALAALATVLTAWPLTTSSQNQAEPIAATSSAMPPWAPAEPQQSMPLPVQAHACSNADSVNRPAAYVQFCHNSPALCDPDRT